MTRRSVKKIDYSKFATSGSSSDDDDFECSAPPIKKLKEKDTATKNNIKKGEKVTKKKQEKKTPNQQTEKCFSRATAKERQPRSSRTSNAERIYEEELNAALQESKKIPTDGNTNHKANNADVSDVITIDDDDDVDSSEERIMKMLTCKKSGTESEGSAFADTLPIQNNISPQKLQQQPLPANNPVNTTDDSSQQANDEDDFMSHKSAKTTDSEDDPVRKRSKTSGRRRTRVVESDEEICVKDEEIMEKKLKSKSSISVEKENGQPCDTTATIEETDKENSPVKRPIKRSTKTKKDTPFTKVSKFLGSAPLSDKEDNVSPLKRNETSAQKGQHFNKFRVVPNNVTPMSRLRLGLSRNRKINKPLHQNVSFKFV
eukprot:TCONS_00053565-protein